MIDAHALMHMILNADKHVGSLVVTCIERFFFLRFFGRFFWAKIDANSKTKKSVQQGKNTVKPIRNWCRRFCNKAVFDQNSMKNRTSFGASFLNGFWQGFGRVVRRFWLILGYSGYFGQLGRFWTILKGFCFAFSCLFLAFSYLLLLVLNFFCSFWLLLALALSDFIWLTLVYSDLLWLALAYSDLVSLAIACSG